MVLSGAAGAAWLRMGMKITMAARMSVGSETALIMKKTPIREWCWLALLYLKLTYIGIFFE